MAPPAKLPKQELGQIFSAIRKMTKIQHVVSRWPQAMAPFVSSAAGAGTAAHGQDLRTFYSARIFVHAVAAAVVARAAVHLQR